MKPLSLILAAMLLTGCAGKSTGKFGGQIAGGNASIVNHTKTIDDTTDSIEGHEPQKKVIHAETKGIRKDAAAIDKAAANWQGYSQGLESKLDWYHRNPLVRFAVWLWYTLWLLPVLFVAYVAVGVITQVYNPIKLLAGLFKAPLFLWRTLRGTPEQ